LSADAEDIATNLAKVVNNRESWPGQKIQRSLRRAGSHSKTPSEQIGEFRILRELGRGGMAIVYLCLDRDLDRQVVVKAPKKALAAESEFRLRFDVICHPTSWIGHTK